MKIFRLSSAYPSCILPWEKAELSDVTFNGLMKAYFYHSVSWADFWKIEFEKMGHVCLEVVSNFERAQKNWANEHSVVYRPEYWRLDIVEKQIKMFRPTVLFLSDYTTFQGDWIRRVREEYNIPLVVGWCAAPGANEETLKSYDLVLTCAKEIQDDFTKLGLESALLHHAFHPIVLERLTTSKHIENKVVFAGQVLNQNQFHTKRLELLRALAREGLVKVYSDSFPSSRREYLASFKKFPIQTPDDFIRERVFWGKSSAGFFGLKMYEILANNLVALNSHIDIATHSAANQRLFEATGVGSCLLTDWKENLEEFFKDGVEVMSYRNQEECVDKARWLLAHPDQARKIGENGQKRTLKEHSFFNRAQKLLKEFEKRL